MTMLRTWAAFLAAVLVAAVPVAPKAAAAAVWFYPQTGHTLTMGFAQFVGDHGGTEMAGLPITEEIDEHGTVVQYFQHLRLEWRPGQASGQQVVVGALGIELGKAQPAFPRAAGAHGAIFFPASGHSLADGFLAYYQSHDGAALLGSPITEELSEGGAVVQYFTNAELQWRAESGVTLADLGAAAAAARGWSPARAPLAPVTTPADARQGTPGAPVLPLTPASLSSVKAGDGNTIPAALQPGGLEHVDLPVLMYHHIGSWPSPYSVSTSNFTAQLDWLQANGYHAVNMHQLYAALFGPAPLAAKPVVISIDDGYPDAAADARQVLLQHHMTATFFIPTVQTPLTATMLRQMDSEGFDIEAHSRTHPDLTTLTDALAWGEIAGSKQDLERILGHRVDLFAYPYGAVNARIVGLLQRAGYQGGILAGGGRAYSSALPFYEPRILVDRGDDLTNFGAKVLGRPYRDTLNVGSSSTGTGDGIQPKPDYHQAPPAAPLPTAGNGSVGGNSGSSGSSGSDTGGYSTPSTPAAGDGTPPNNDGSGSSGATSGDGSGTGADPATTPTGRGEIYV